MDDLGIGSCSCVCCVAKHPYRKCAAFIRLKSCSGGRHMEARTIRTVSLLAFAAALVGGCASNSSSPLSTASVMPDKMAPSQMAAKVDPACVSLSNQIDTLRGEGTVERLEKAAAGKTASVQVKRASLAKQAELNKANADFQAKCGPQIPKAQTAQLGPAAAEPIAAAMAAKAAPAVAAKVAPIGTVAGNAVASQAKAAAQQP